MTYAVDLIAMIAIWTMEILSMVID